MDGPPSSSTGNGRSISAGGSVVREDFLPIAGAHGADLALAKPFEAEAMLLAVRDLLSAGRSD